MSMNWVKQLIVHSSTELCLPRQVSQSPAGWITEKMVRKSTIFSICVVSVGVKGVQMWAQILGCCLLSWFPAAIIHTSLWLPRVGAGWALGRTSQPSLSPQHKLGVHPGWSVSLGGRLSAGVVVPDCPNSRSAPVRGAGKLPDSRAPISLGINQLWWQLESTGCCPVAPAVLQHFQGLCLSKHCALGLVLQNASSQIGLACAVRAKYCYYSCHSLWWTHWGGLKHIPEVLSKTHQQGISRGWLLPFYWCGYSTRPTWHHHFHRGAHFAVLLHESHSTYPSWCKAVWKSTALCPLEAEERLEWT